VKGRTNMERYDYEEQVIHPVMASGKSKVILKGGTRLESS